MNTNHRLERLRVIEAHATRARSAVQAQFALLGIEPMVLDDMLFVATLLTQGPVTSKPNLRQGRVRLAGLLVFEGAPRIWFEQYDPPVRQRFSIAHELGHYVLHLPYAPGIYHRCCQDDVDREEAPPDAETLSIEQEADAFAGAFLMNADDVRADLAQFGRCVAFLAERYSVSEAAMRRRLRTLEMLTQ